MVVRYLKRLLGTLVVVTVLLAQSSAVHALSPEQKRIFNSGIFYFDVDSGDNACTGGQVINGSVDRFLQVLAFQESGGKISIESGISSASGKYQYINKTWKARYSIYGPASNYERAKDAPEEIQDAVAYIEYTKAFRDLDNDLFKLAINHFTPAANTNPAKLDVVPPGNNITPRQYANKLIENVNKGIAMDIPLKYSQAPEFNFWLEKAGGAPPTINGESSGYNGSSCSGIDSNMGLRSKIVSVAKQELNGGAKESDNTYLKYTNNNPVEWCAYFVSWVVKEAGNPFNPDPQPSAASILAYAKNINKFHPKGEADYTPKPGDIAIYKENKMPYPSHVNIVIAYNDSTKKYTTIGGNESDMVKQSDTDINSPALTGFMSVD